jgi:DNA-binding HxlR family transcriptional regulator
LIPQAKKKSSSRAAGPSAAHILEDVLGCKWTLGVLGCIRAGTVRPGAILANLDGLTTKVLNERLRKLVRFGLVTRTAYPEIPPRVEYHLSPFGRRFARLLDQVQELQQELDRSEVARGR